MPSSLTGSQSGNNSGARLDVGHADAFEKSVWYWFDCPTNGEYRFTLSCAFAPRIAVYTGADLASLVRLAIGTNTITFTGVAGTRYTICVGGNTSSDFGPLDLDWLKVIYGCTSPAALNYNPLANTDDGSCEFPVSNDNFSDATTISGASGTVSGNNTGYTVDAGHDDAIERSAWFKWTAPSNDDFSFDALGTVFLGDGFPDTILAAYTGSAVDALTQLDWNDDDGFTGGDSYISKITFTAAASTTYYICLGGYNSSEFGRYQLNWAPA